jgi:hypothetical protein
LVVSVAVSGWAVTGESTDTTTLLFCTGGGAGATGVVEVVGSLRVDAVVVGCGCGCGVDVVPVGAC